MTTFDNPNVFNIAVNGNFDDCQKLVKDLFNINNKQKKLIWQQSTLLTGLGLWDKLFIIFGVS